MRARVIEHFDDCDVLQCPMQYINCDNRPDIRKKVLPTMSVNPTIAMPPQAHIHSTRTSYDSDSFKEDALKGYQVDIESCVPRHWRNFVTRLASAKRFLDGKVNRTEISSLFCNILVIFLIFVLPNIIAAVMGFVYVYAAVNPLSSINAALHFSQGSYIAYEVALPVITIPAGLLNLVLLIGGIKIVSRHTSLMFLSLVVAFTPIWCPYVIEAALRKHLWNVECDGFDMTIYLDAIKYNQQGLSGAQFPTPVMGGAVWQIYQSEDGVWNFGPEDAHPQITFFLGNETYTLHNVTEGTLVQEPLSFPDLGLHSDGNWIRSCYPPAVLLQNATHEDVVMTGLSAYTNCARQQVCANTNMGIEAVVVSIGRILIALQEAASCCSRSRWS